MDTKKITKLPVLETLPENSHILVEDGTGAKRVPKAAMTVEIDATLTKEGAAADAKATGNAIGEVKGKIGSLLMFTEIVPETVLNFDGMTMMENPFHLPLAKDEKYTVIYDEDEYEVTAFLPDPEAANQIAIGNYAIDGMPGEDTSEPFFIVYDPDVAATMMIVAEAGEHVISVYGNKLSPAFMPYIPNTASIPRGYAVQSGSTGFHFNTDLGASGAEIKQAIIDGGTACIEFSYGVLWYAGTVNQLGMEMYLFTGVGYDKKTDETMLPIVMQAIVNADDPETLLISRQEVAMAKNSIIPEAYIPDTIARTVWFRGIITDITVSPQNSDTVQFTCNTKHADVAAMLRENKPFSVLMDMYETDGSTVYSKILFTVTGISLDDQYSSSINVMGSSGEMVYELVFGDDERIIVNDRSAAS